MLRSALIVCALSAAIAVGDDERRPEQAGSAAQETRSARDLTADLAAPDAAARTRAACGLRELGDRAVDAIAALVRLLPDGAPVDGTICGRRWSRHGEENLTSPGEEAAAALVAIGTRAFEPALKAMKQDAWIARRNAAWALGALDDNRAVAALSEALRDREAPVREQASWALGAIDDSTAVPALIAAIDDPDPRVRRQIAWALGALDDARAVPALAKALGDADDKARSQAAWALGAIDDRSAVPALARALADKSAPVRKQVAWALGAIDDTGAVEPLTKALTDASPEVREQAAWALGAIGDSRAIPGLLGALKDDSVGVRRQAAWAIGAIREINMLQDLAFGVRLLARSPGFSLIAIAALSIGIGANTAIFSVINTLLLQPLPYRDADRLAIVWEHNTVRNRLSNVVGPANFIHWREMNSSFEDLAALTITYSVTVTGNGEPEELQVQSISAELFQILGVSPARGRSFTAAENQPNARVVVISDRLWRRRFGGDPGILDRALVSQGTPYTVVGVMPPEFSFLDKTVDVWLPIGFTAQARTPRGRSLMVVGRLKPGVSVERAQADMTHVSARLTGQFPDFNTGWTSRVVLLREQLTGDVRPALVVLAGAVAFVLLIACANVANLLLARATSRQRELAVRAALGAGRARLVRQLLAESVVLSLLGGAGGLLLAWWALGVLRAVAAERLPIQRLEMVGLDLPVLLFTLGASIACGLVFGVVPALTASGSSLTDALKDGGRSGSSARGNRTRSAFVVVEIALALVLLVGAGLLLRSFVRLLDQHPGFDPTRTVTMRLSLPQARYGAEGQRAQFLNRFFEDVDALPGVTASGAISFLPLTGLGAATSMRIIGQPEPPKGQEPVTDVRVITHEYLEAMGVPLVRGRLFNERDAADAKGRVVINETMAQKYWPGEDPIGKRVQISWDNIEDEVIGVVGDVRHAALDSEIRPMTYWPYARNPYGTMTVTIRTSGDATRIVSSVVGLVRQRDPELVVANVKTMDEVVSNSVAERRLTMLLLAIFAGAALLLAAVGIYGVIAYGVTQRTQEIGIRMALGAGRADVLVMVVRQAMVLTLAGIAAGGLGALVLTRLMEGLLFQVRPSDPVTFAAVSGLLAAVAVLASYIPGRRAARVDPVIALRAE